MSLEPECSFGQLYSATVISKSSFFARAAVFDAHLKRALIRPNSLERSCPSPIMEGAIERVALNYAVNSRSVDPPAKRQNTASLGTNDEMLIIDGALHAAGLVGPFEMAGNDTPLLAKIEELGRG